MSFLHQHNHTTCTASYKTAASSRYKTVLLVRSCAQVLLYEHYVTMRYIIYESYSIPMYTQQHPGAKIRAYPSAVMYDRFYNILHDKARLRLHLGQRLFPQPKTCRQDATASTVPADTIYIIR
eukprot:5501020-Pleurochrysis_carterae.AAC.2